MHYSRQREEILEQLQPHRDHPTAERIFAELKEKDPSISLATVYRNLRVLSEQGKIQRLTFAKGADHFDPNVRPHSHFVCDRCGRVLDVPIPDQKHLDEEAQASVGGTISGHDLVFYGICDDCESREQK